MAKFNPLPQTLALRLLAIAALCAPAAAQSDARAPLGSFAPSPLAAPLPAPGPTRQGAAPARPSGLCPPLRLELSIDQRPARIDQTHSSFEFAAHSSAYFDLARADGQRRADERSGMTLGLYSSNRKAPAQFDLSYAPDGPHHTAICLASVTLQYSVDPVIYLAREIPPGPCLDEVYQHELGHLDIDYNAALLAQASLRQWGAQTQNRIVAPNAQASSTAQALLDAVVNRAYSHLFDAQTQGHRRHDGVGPGAALPLLSASCHPLLRQLQARAPSPASSAADPGPHPRSR